MICKTEAILLLAAVMSLTLLWITGMQYEKLSHATPKCEDYGYKTGKVIAMNEKSQILSIQCRK